jgi:predicted ArsR family transcriptional regulator
MHGARGGLGAVRRRPPVRRGPVGSDQRDLRHVRVVKSLRLTGHLRHNGVVKNVRPAQGSARAGSAGAAPTRGQVARLILELGPSTAATLGGRLGLTPAAIRRHLDYLLAEGLIETRTARTYGNRGRGRPAKVFVITDAGRSAFEHAYDDLATGALRFLAETAGPQAVAEFARRQVGDLERRYAPAVGQGELAARVQALAEALSADGYAASAGPAPAIGGMSGEQLCQHHCPVAHVAAEFPQLCEAETEAFGRLLGTPVQRLATIAHGDGICTTHVTGQPIARAGTGKSSTVTAVIQKGIFRPPAQRRPATEITTESGGLLT